jgi:hypothetical protein
MVTRSFIRLVLPLMLLAAGGCATSELWSDAARRDVSLDRLAGVVDTPAGRSLVVVYDGDSSMQIALDARGHPVPPFDGTGAEGDADRIPAMIPAAQKAAIERTAGPVSDGVPLVDGGEAGRFPYVLKGLSGSFAAAGYLFDGGRWRAVSAVADDPTGSTTSPGDAIFRFPPGTIIVLLPEYRARPSAARGRARLRAALLTPIAVPFDVVTSGLAIALLPPYLIYIAAGGATCP